MSSEPVSRLELERWALGELPPEEVRALEARASADQALRAHMARVQHDIDQARDRLPAFEPPLRVVSTRRWAVLVGGVGALAAALLVAVGIPRGPATTFRGALDVQFERIRDGRVQEQGALIEVQEGDRVQYVVTPSASGHLGVFDVQDDGQMFVWLEPGPVEAWVPVPGAAEMDDYEGSERVFIVFDVEPFDTADVREAVDRAWHTPLADLDALPMRGTEQRSVWLVRP